MPLVQPLCRAPALLTLVVVAGACAKDAAPAPAVVAEAPAPAADAAPDGAPVVRRDATTLLFSFVDQDGRIRAVSKVDEVPDPVKPRVLVVDVARSPEQRQAHKVAYFADLTTERDDGTFPVSVVSRYDAADPSTTAPSALPPVPPGTVVVYSAQWCGFCKKAKAWLAEQGVPYVERDVERQPGAQQELAAKLKQAGVQGGGIPVIDWGGQLVMGFDVRRLAALKDGAAPAEGGR